MTSPDNLDRIPTKFERILGAAASLLIFLFLAVVIAISSYYLFGRNESPSFTVIVTLCGLALLAIWAARMFLRAAFGTLKKPSPSAQLVVGIVATIVSAGYLVVLVVTAIQTDAEIHQSGLAATFTMMLGIAWSRHGWKLRQSDKV